MTGSYLSFHKNFKLDRNIGGTYTHTHRNVGQQITIQTKSHLTATHKTFTLLNSLIVGKRRGK